MNYIKIRFVDRTDRAESEFFNAVDELLRLPGPRFTLARHNWRPQVDIYETPEEIVVQVEIAGVRQESIALEIAPDMVKISGTRAGYVQREDARFRLAEIPCGDFERSLSLPALIDTETATAAYSNGLLEIRLTKRPPDRIRRIQIQQD